MLWKFGLMGLTKILSYSIKGDGEFHKPTPSKLQDIERDIVNIDPSGGLVRLPLGPDCPDKFRWVVRYQDLALSYAALSSYVGADLRVLWQLEAVVRIWRRVR